MACEFGCGLGVGKVPQPLDKGNAVAESAPAPVATNLRLVCIGVLLKTDKI